MAKKKIKTKIKEKEPYSDKMKQNMDPFLKSVRGIDTLLGWVLVAAIVLIPLAVGAKLVFFYSPVIGSTLLLSGTKVSMFSYIKWVFLMLLAVAAMLLLLIKILLFKYRLQKSYLLIPLCLLMLLNAASAALAQYPGIAMNGFYARYEGMSTIIAYLVLSIVALNIKASMDLIRNILLGLSFVAVMIALANLFDFYGFNFMENIFFRNLFVPSELLLYIKGSFATPISNPNFVSGFSGALVALYIVLSVRNDEPRKTILYATLAVISFASLVASISLSGYVALLVSAPVILFLITLQGNWKKVLTIVLPITVACFGIVLIMSAHNPWAGEEITKIFGMQTNGKQDAIAEGMNPAAKSGAANTAPNLYYDEVMPEAKYSAGTGRFYIWQNTVQLIIQRPLLGYGPNTLPFYFPQDDKAKISNLSSYNTVVDKPHNMYLEWAFNSGIPILFILLIMIGAYYYYSYCRVIQKKNEPQTIFYDAVLVFLLAFLVQWLFNDSYIATSPVFWVLFGLAAPDGSKLAKGT